jgi:hypothetical protein
MHMKKRNLIYFTRLIYPLLNLPERFLKNVNEKLLIVLVI